MPKATDVGGRPFSGLGPSTVVGIVTDNVDPDELGRIKVKFPTLASEPASFWIRQHAPMAGKERGFYTLPEKEDEVMVMFMQGSHDTGVIVGQFWNGVDKPPKEAKDGLPGPAKQEVPGGQLSKDKFTDGSKDLSKNDRRFWKSRSGHLFVFDDTDGKESIQMWDKAHILSMAFDTKEKRIILANTDGDIHIRTKNHLWLEAGQDIKWRAGNDIVGESANNTKHKVGQNWTVDTQMDSTLKTGQNFTIDAGMGITFKAKMNCNVSGDMNAEFKGGINATLTSSAITTVKGGMVKIN
jgi:uncharacterized protein involved in type VI secretion and phage assembly